MAFSTQRGRPRKPLNDNDVGTPELRLKHALRLTAEPIDLCLEKRLITEQQHWCGLHLRWLYTLRYGAPKLTTIYVDPHEPGSAPLREDEDWRAMREREYGLATDLLKTQRRYECVMRLAVYNERPAFLDQTLYERALHEPPLAQELSRMHLRLRDGLELLVKHWQRPRIHAGNGMQATPAQI